MSFVKFGDVIVRKDRIAYIYISNRNDVKCEYDNRDTFTLSYHDRRVDAEDALTKYYAKLYDLEACPKVNLGFCAPRDEVASKSRKVKKECKKPCSGDESE